MIQARHAGVPDAPAWTPPAPTEVLPYGRTTLRVLNPLRHLFRRANALITPFLAAGGSALVSNPITGYLMVLRTRGRRTGRARQAPLGYVVLDGAVYFCAGFGTKTAWYRNLVADDRVEVVLPGRTITGRAVPVTDPEERVRAYRALLGSLGIVSRLVVGDLRRLDDATLLERHRAIPLVRVRPMGLRAGPLDPGGRFWLVPQLACALVALRLMAALRSPQRRPASS